MHRIYIYTSINVCHLKEFIVHLFATPSFHASSRNFFFSSLSYDENERLFRKDDFHRAVKSIRYRDENDLIENFCRDTRS